MEIETQYASKLFFPSPSFVQVYFEAIANSFDACATEIDIQIDTNGGVDSGDLQVTISDNGGGFTDERFSRFRRLQEPHDPFHKGLGRLVYLQYFRQVTVTSVYGRSTRRFVFTNNFSGDSQDTKEMQEPGQKTELVFSGFVKDRLRSYDDVRAESVKGQIIDHFLPLLHRKTMVGEPFKITIRVHTNEANTQQDFYSQVVSITPDDIPRFQVRTIDTGLPGLAPIQMAFSIRDVGSAARVLTAIAVDERTVPIKLLGPKAVPPNHSVTVLFSSDFFRGGSDTARQRLVLPDDVANDQLFRLLRKEVAKALNEALPEIQKRNEQSQQHFEERYPHLAGLFDTESVGLVDREEAIKTAQWRFFEQQRDVLEGRDVPEEAFHKSLELSARTLLEYVLYREIVIKRLADIGADEKEEQIHNLIVPRYRTFEGGEVVDNVYSNNAWLLDDKFMSFRTILSESRMDEVIRAVTLEDESNSSEGRPDIALIFSADPDNQTAVDVVVVEVKRKGVDDKEGPYAATQLSKRARKLVDHCPNIQRMWYFGIIDIDEQLEQLLLDTKWTPLFSRGHVFYQDFQLRRADGKMVPAPTCLVSFDAVVKDAQARNHTFLEILKSDLRKAAHEFRHSG